MVSSNREFLKQVYQMFDGGAGKLTEETLHDVCRFLKLKVSRKFVHNMLISMDTDGNGTVEIEEFYAFFDKTRSVKELQAEVKAMHVAAVRTLKVQKFSAAVSMAGAVV